MAQLAAGDADRLAPHGPRHPRLELLLRGVGGVVDDALTLARAPAQVAGRRRAHEIQDGRDDVDVLVSDDGLRTGAPDPRVDTTSVLSR